MKLFASGRQRELCAFWLAGLLAACVTQPTALPARTPSATLPPPTLTLTATPRPSPTSTPTRTPSPRPSATPAPCLETVTPAPAQLRTEPLEVTYISDGDLYQWREADGATQRLTTHGEAQQFWVSPDRQVIAFVRGVSSLAFANTEIWAVNSDGSNERQLASAEFFAGVGTDPHPAYVGNGPARIRWQPGSHTLQFRVAPRINAIGGSITYFPGVWTVNADTLERRKLPDSADPWVDDYSLGHVFAPNGWQVAIVTASDISVTTVDGRGRRDTLLIYPQLGVGEILGTPQVAWTPDSRALRVILWATDPTNQLATAEAFTTWLVPVDGPPPQQLARFEGYAFNVNVSPDQQRLAYLRSGNRVLVLARFDGAAERVYDAGPSLSFFGWAPDSVRFAYGGYEFNGPPLPVRLGHICGPSAALTDIPVQRFLWLDDERFLFTSTDSKGQERSLWLGRVDAPAQRLAEALRWIGQFDYNRER